MPEAVSDKDLEKLRDKGDKLREQIAAAEAEAAQKITDASNAIVQSQLEAENARLEARLAAAKAAAKTTTIKEGSEGLHATLDEQLEAAKAAAAAPQGPVDPNAGVEDDKKNGGNS